MCLLYSYQLKGERRLEGDAAQVMRLRDQSSFDSIYTVDRQSWYWLESEFIVGGAPAPLVFL